MAKLSTDSLGRDRWAIVEKFRAEKGMDKKTLAKFLGCSTKTIYNLMERPGGLKIEQVRRMKLDDHDLHQLIYGKER